MILSTRTFNRTVSFNVLRTWLESVKKDYRDLAFDFHEYPIVHIVGEPIRSEVATITHETTLDEMIFWIQTARERGYYNIRVVPGDKRIVITGERI